MEKYTKKVCIENKIDIDTLLIHKNKIKFPIFILIIAPQIFHVNGELIANSCLDHFEKLLFIIFILSHLQDNTWSLVMIQKMPNKISPLIIQPLKMMEPV